MKRKGRQSGEILGLRYKDHFREASLVPALKAGLIEMTIAPNPAAANRDTGLPKREVILLRLNREGTKIRSDHICFMTLCIKRD